MKVKMYLKQFFIKISPTGFSLVYSVKNYVDFLKVHLRVSRTAGENLSDDAESATEHLLHLPRRSHPPKHSLL